MATFEVCWKLDGTAIVKAKSMDEAIKKAEAELEVWSGMGFDDIQTISIDGVEVFD